MSDDDLRPPPERDVSPQLRARVLHGALEGSSPTRTRRRLVVPVLAGLAAAGVVVATIAFVRSDDSTGHEPPIAGNGSAPTVLVHRHSITKVDRRQLAPSETHATHAACMTRGGTQQAGQIRANRLQNSPFGPIPILAYANVEKRPQYLCTPYAVMSTGMESLVTSSSNPVIAVRNSRVQVRSASGDGSDDQVYVDGAWFSTASTIATVEVRITVGDQPGSWFSTKRVGNIMFAPAWVTLTTDQVDEPLTVEYRAITVDGYLRRIPDLQTSVVVPAEVAQTTPSIPDVPAFG